MGLFSLIGGILGRNAEKKAIAAQNEYNNPANVRARAEAAGFNPLLFVGPGVGQQTATGGTNYMGQAIADAGLMLADKITERQSSVRLNQAMDDNRRLQQQLAQATIRPKVAGIYAGSEMLPSQTAALGGSRGVSASGAVADAGGDTFGDRGPLEANPYNPKWGLTVMDPTVELGYGILDNPNLGRPFRYPSVNGEMLDIWQLPVLSMAWAYENAVPMAGDIASTRARSARDAELFEFRRQSRSYQSQARENGWGLMRGRDPRTGRAPMDIILTRPGSPEDRERLRGPVRSW